MIFQSPIPGCSDTPYTKISPYHFLVNFSKISVILRKLLFSRHKHSMGPRGGVFTDSGLKQHIIIASFLLRPHPRRSIWNRRVFEDASNNAEWKRLHLWGDLTKNFDPYSYIAMESPSCQLNLPSLVIRSVESLPGALIECTVLFQPVWYFSNLVLTFQKRDCDWKQSEVNLTEN